tara:strand:+ start:36212 stop:37987 length:1776 start_codon:yes stop_codon:yes gene_type:complete
VDYPRRLFVKFVLLLLPFIAYSQTYKLDDVVISSKRDLSGPFFTTDVETIKSFEEAGNEKLVDVLETLPGVSINQSGAPGQQATIRIRGSEGRHVLVLVDGVRVNDPTDPNKSFNPALLNVGDVERVEVLKGAQTLLYGSDAIGGVVNIITKKGSEKDYITLSAGYSRGIQLDNTFTFGDSVLHTHIFHDKAEGISAANGEDEDDGYENKGFTLNLFHSFNEKFEGDWTFKVTDQFSDTDNVDFSTGVPIDADGDYAKNIQQVFSQKLNYKTSSGKLSHLLGLNKIDRFNKYGSSIVGSYGKELTNEIHWNQKVENGSYLLGLENYSESFSQDDLDEKYTGLTSLVLIRDYKEGPVFGQLGARASYHTEAESNFSPSIGLGKFYGDHRVAFNYQQGFKAPTLYQLYGPFSTGNNELDAETSEYVDLNYSYKKLFELSLFYNRIDDFIGFEGNYINTDWLESYGLEINSQKNIGAYELNSGLFLASFNQADGKKALRRPSQKVTFGVGRDFGEGQSLRISYVWSGKRFDRLKTNGETLELDPYSLVDVHYERSFKDFTLNTGIENAFGEDYKEAFGYAVQPFTVYGRVKYSY